MHWEYGRSSVEASGDRSPYGRHACYGHDRCMVLVAGAGCPCGRVAESQNRGSKMEARNFMPFGNDGTGRHSIGGHSASGYVGKGTIWGAGVSSGLAVDY